MTSPYSPLHDPFSERAACGLGFVARTGGERSHEIVQYGLQMLANLDHRGAGGSDAETGDGAGVLLQMPHRFFVRMGRELPFTLPAAGRYAVGNIFLSRDPVVREACEHELERIAAEEGQPVLGWRDVPVCAEEIGATARAVMPCIRQVFIERRTGTGDTFERKLYLIRRRLHRVVEDQYGGPAACYLVSLSARTIVYKGLLRARQVGPFYPDLRDPATESALALVHSRFSTNTLGSWPLAHPYRYVAHNGEINTLRGNVNWMRARESTLHADLFVDDMERIRPVVEPKVSDSASLDNALELLTLSGRSLPHAVMMMVPEAWEGHQSMDPDRRAFYEYHSALMEPWDGPAAIAFTDGRIVGATLDRNGLRPARYSITRDGLVVLASEEGVLPLPPDEVNVKWRLEPGHMLVVDTVEGRVLFDDEIKAQVARRRPYKHWVQDGMTTLEALLETQDTENSIIARYAVHDRIDEPADQPVRGPVHRHDTDAPVPLPVQQAIFGYTLEDLGIVLTPMATGGKEADGSMGTDTPPAVLSQRPQLLFSYFKQLFAQVTNPPIDPLRETLVMSLRTMLGPGLNILDESPEHCRKIVLEGPVLSGDQLAALLTLERAPFVTARLSTLFHARPDELEDALEALCDAAEREVRSGAGILVLSDRGVDAGHAPIPALLAVSAVHHHLVRQGIRMRTSLVVETGEAREVHHLALLVGYGAAAVCPYLAYDTVAEMARSGALPGVASDQAVANTVAALHKGLLKVLSKMGISTVSSYCGAQVFEAVGLARDLIDRHFTGTSSRIAGSDIADLEDAALRRHSAAFLRDGLDIGGEYRLRVQGEQHGWNPESITALQRAVATGNFSTFKEFTAHFDGESARAATLRGLFTLQPDPIPLHEVEPASEIVKRFSTGAMSFGSLSEEAHETLAVAMNRMGGKSNSGEGGEDPERSRPDTSGDSRRSAIKQVASARFGVTAHYLADADVLQIKMAQGAKPGEGGQLPGHKVSADIARVRHSTPGVGLISPPPHHDIYSIEDLAQLIHDLKNVNPAAQVSVKLVAEVGVGTIAAGVAKAKADHITISGYDGGTGASPLSSIRHAGLPWELGLAEAQQVLVANGLRGRIRLQVDGQLKTGRDVVIGALLGAEEFAFSTAPLVATGCVMMRACHLNTCPVGIATQDPELRRRFAGKPEHVINYFFFLAEEVRELMASLGFRTFDEMVGRVDRLSTDGALQHWQSRGLDLSGLLATPRRMDGSETGLHHTETQDHALDAALDHRLIERVEDALARRRPVELQVPIRNINRTVGGMLSGEIVRRHGPAGLPDGSIDITFNGAAGQSFGAWAAPGLTLTLDGEANDHVGKGLSGGRIVVRPPQNAGYEPERSIVVGNVALFGATSGEAFFRGVAGERFAVRNSGASAVVEGVGDHGCEYMTGGTVVVLGSTGRNFAAGMSGGTAYVLDLWGRFESACNLDMVGLEPVEATGDVAELHRLLQAHVRWTRSRTAMRILSHWQYYLPRFTKVMPHDLKRALAEQEPERLDIQAG